MISVGFLCICVEGARPLTVHASSQHNSVENLPDPFNEIPKDLEDIRSGVTNEYLKVHALTEDQYLYFRKRLCFQDPNAAKELVSHYGELGNGIQMIRYELRAARWGHVNMHSGLRGRIRGYGETGIDDAAIEYWQRRGAVLGNEYCAEQLKEKGIPNRMQQFGFMRICVKPKGDIEIFEAAGEYKNFAFGATWPGEYDVFLTSDTDAGDSLKRVIVRVKSDELVDVVFDPRANAEPIVTHVPVLEVELPMVTDLGFSNERSFMVGPGLDIIFRRIEPGVFRMGSYSDGEWMLGLNEEEIKTPYWLSRFLITQGVFNSIMGSGNQRSKGPLYPIEVTWEEAREFCRLLTEREKKAGRIPKNMFFDLPTEVQWEYALLAGRTDYDWLRRLCDSKQICSIKNEELTEELDRSGWFTWNNSGNDVEAVGRKEPNEWGLYDMVGYPIEMCLDKWSGDERQGTGHVIRGSGQIFSDRLCLSNDQAFSFRVCLQERAEGQLNPCAKQQR
jgi:hypothetical protein